MGLLRLLNPGSRGTVSEFCCVLFTVILGLQACASWALYEKGTTAAQEYSNQIEQLLALSPDSVSKPSDAADAIARFDQVIHGVAKVEDFETAGRLARKCREIFPGQLRSGLLLGWVAGLAGNLDSAIETTRACLAEGTRRLPDPDKVWHAEALANLGCFLIQKEQYKEAVPYLEQSRKENQKPALPDYLAGLAYHHVGEPWLCGKAYEKAFKKDESLASPSDYVFHAWAEDRMGHLDKAGAILAKALERFPMSSGLHVNLGLNKEAQSATREAYYEYRMELLLGQDDSPYSDEAKKRIERIERIQVNTPFADPELKSVIEYLRRKAENNLDLADKLLDSAVAANSLKNPFIVYLRAQRLEEKDDYQGAIKVLEDATQNDPSQVLLQIDLAEAYGKAGVKDKANELIKKLLLVAPDHWKLKQLVGPSAKNGG
jgi:tetratricopeptide (TPR) repeat protein